MNILITGASSGIGYATALKLSENKENQILAVARRKGNLEKLQVESEATYGHKNVLAARCDLTSDLHELDAYLDNFEQLDVLINNAGALVNKPFEEIDDEDWRAQFEINVISPARLIKKCLPLLKQSKRAHVVNISSIAGFQGSSKFPGLAAYSSSKAALASLSELLAEEFNPLGVKVNCLAFGAVQTDMLEKAFPGFKALINPTQMAEYVADFALNAHKVMNGKIIPVSLSTP